MLKGCDLSRHNGANAVLNAIATDADIKFIICKATEGRGYKDPMFDNHMRAALNNNRMVGAYHYARPETGNTPAQEARTFVNAVSPYIGNCLLALDWEGDALKASPKWALEWCEEVASMTGVNPVVYVQESYVKKMTCFKGKNFGLWVAKWSNSEPQIAPWNVWALWQYSNKPFDLDKFNGSEAQFRMYCMSSTGQGEDVESCGNHHCGCSCECCKE